MYAKERELLGSYLDRACFLSTQVEETFIRTKVPWTKNKRELNDCIFRCFVSGELRINCDGVMYELKTDAVSFVLMQRTSIFDVSKRSALMQVGS